VRRLLLLVVALIVYGSLYPWSLDFDRSGANPLWVLLHAWPQGIDRFVLRDAAINLALYFPLGVAAFLAVARRHGRLVAFDAALLIALGLSASMEMLQIYDPGRTCSLLDVFCNVSGAAAGALAALILRPELESLARRKPGWHGPAALLLVACWASYQLYPFFPVISQTKLRASLELLAESASVSPVEVWANAAGWMAAALVMEAFFGNMRPRWLLAAMACLPVRLLIAQRSLTLSEALGAALALLLWSLLPERKRLLAGVFLLASATVLRELSPFRLAETPHPFSWIPFVATFDSERQSATVILLRKAFEYGALVWLFRARGISYARAAVAVAASLAILEAIQRYLPGRTPEITDSVVALLMALVLWRLSSRAAPSHPEPGGAGRRF
jgi:VanZ family protein